MTVRRRFARTALLLGGGAALAAAMVLVATPSQVTATVPPLPQLPWGSVDGAGRPTPPGAILYVSERCGHCAPAARAASRAAAAAGVPLLVVAHGSPGAAGRYARTLAIEAPVAADTNGALGRALRIRAVPALFVFRRDGTRSVLVGFNGPRAYTRVLHQAR